MPAMFHRMISLQNLQRGSFNTLRSISAIITNKEKDDLIGSDKKALGNLKEDDEEDNELSDQVFQCEVCQLELLSEAQCNKHKNLSGHWR